MLFVVMTTSVGSSISQISSRKPLSVFMTLTGTSSTSSMEMTCMFREFHAVILQKSSKPSTFATVA
ncbi:hypothetical protein D3C72_2490890 [compost metagenome]